MTNIDTARASFTLVWTLDASPAEVFRAWTDPKRLDWFYNDSMPVPSQPIELDLRVGGIWRQRMVEHEGRAYDTGGVYLEIVPDEKLVFAWGATGGWPDLDPERLDESPHVTVMLESVGGCTEMSVYVELPPGLSEAAVQDWFALGIRAGWQATIDRLAARF